MRIARKVRSSNLEHHIFTFQFIILEWTKENMLIILGHLLSLVPSEVQSRELPPLLPLLFQGKEPTSDNPI